MFLVAHIKSWIYPAFLLLITSTYSQLSISKPDLLYSTSIDPQWLALIHAKNNQPQITDPKFLLSADSFSAERELLKTLELFERNGAGAYCRFPSRYSFLKERFQLDSTLQNTATCPELQKYLDLVPFDALEIVFASEVLTSSSSMMGHTFLKASGKNINENDVSHSISFFAEISTFNPFSVFYDSLISGLDGFFMVRPYTKDHARYLEQEDRNLWSYTLKFNEKQRKLLQLHIWELKDLELKYLFQSYNCSTLTLYVLAIAEPKLKQEEKLFVSPNDVVKAAKTLNLVSSEEVFLSADWELNMLEENLSANIKRRVLNFTNQTASLDISDLDATEKALIIKYASNIINRQHKPTSAKYQNIKKQLETLEVSANSESEIFLNNYKKPTKKPQDSAISAVFSHSNQRSHIEVTLLPASHRLHGDNRQLFTESELKIAEITFDLDLHNDSAKLKEFTLYSATSYNPSNRILPQVSGAFHLGYKQTLDNNFADEGNLDLSGAVGKTFRFHEDILFFSMIGGGALSSINETSLYVNPHAGLIVNLIADSKLILEQDINFGQLDSKLLTTSATFSWYGIENITMKLQYSGERSAILSKHNYAIGIDFHF